MKTRKRIICAVMATILALSLCACEKEPSAEDPFTTSEYSQREIRQLAEEGLSLEEAAQKIHTIVDARNFLKASGFRFDYSYNSCAIIDGIGWNWTLSADFVYSHMAGTCGGIANLLNVLLAGDYDEQGYVRYLGAHIFNYFKQGTVYYFYDLASYFNYGQIMAYACEDVGDFTEYYLTHEPMGDSWDNPEDENYLRFFYCIPLDGENALAIAIQGNTAFVPRDAEDNLITLYLRDGCRIEFIDFDSEKHRPSEENVPDDAHFNYLNGDIYDDDHNVIGNAFDFVMRDSDDRDPENAGKDWGDGKLTQQQLEALSRETDYPTLRQAISTVPDLLQYLDLKPIKESLNDDYTKIFETGHATPRAVADFANYLLEDDMEELYTAEIVNGDDHFFMSIFKLNGEYYGTDPFGYKYFGDHRYLISAGADIHAVMEDLVAYRRAETCELIPFTS